MAVLAKVTTERDRIVQFRVVENKSDIPVNPKCKIIECHGSTAMDCLHTEEEIQSVYEVFEKRFIGATTIKKKTIALRNLTVFVCNINLGLRGGDFFSLKWNNIFNKEWKYLINPDFVPEKTRKHKKHMKLIWNSEFENALNDWLAWKNKYVREQKLTDYIFDGQKNKNSDGYGHYTSKAFYKVIEEVRKEAGIHQKIGNHGCRKTMVNRYIKNSDNRLDGLEEMSAYLNHANIRTTRAYSCTEVERIQEVKERMSVICGNNKDSKVSSDLEHEVISEFRMYAQIIAKQHDLTINEVINIIKKMKVGR